MVWMIEEFLIAFLIQYLYIRKAVIFNTYNNHSMKIKHLLLFFYFLSLFNRVHSQNETKKWYFGVNAGLDFNSSPPTILTNTTMNTGFGCATIADASGNLLFYTNGQTVWNQNHAVMANGSGLNGNAFACQSSIIVKQPGSSSIYHIFTTGNQNGLCYSTVDMSLAAGLGSVTVQNVFLVYSYFSEKISAVLHCNGTDVWVLARDGGWNGFNNYLPINFQAFLVSAAGVSTTPVTSPANNMLNNNWGYNDYGCMKISPNGKKVGVAVYDYNWNNINTTTSTFELYDFNATTGVVSNSLGLNPTVTNNFNYYFGYGCEFSPDGTKFYGSFPYNWNITTSADIVQWDLCAGSDSAIIASQYTISTINNFTITNYAGSMQLAPDGKIYVSRYYRDYLDVINNPNQAGAASNYSPNAQSIAPSTNYWGLPNFIVSYFDPLYQQNLPPFTYTVNYAASCLTATFTAPNPTLSCPAISNSLISLAWSFGDAASGAANTSTLNNPAHSYPTPGTYTAQLVYNYECGSDTVIQPVIINGALINVNTASITCASLGSATVIPTGGIGPFSYTWMPTGQSSSVATGLSPGNYSITVVDNGGNCTFTSTATFVSLVPFIGVVNNSSSISCNGATTGTANIPVSGGSGNNNYFWYNGVSTQTTATVNNLAAGLHTITVIDAITSCSVVQFFQINQPPPLNLTIVANTPTACAGSSISFTAANSGGTPGPGAGYTYTWTGGAATPTRNVSQATAGAYVYTVSSLDGNNCLSTQTISTAFIVNPTLTVLNSSICPLQTATLTASGATSYTWMPSSTISNTFSASPLTTSAYTVFGSASGCSATPITAMIILKPLPSPTITSNSPICNNQSLVMGTAVGSSYLWAGPLNYTSALQNPSISPASPSNSGVYTLTFTAINGCSATTTSTLIVNPTPTIVVSVNTVCVNQTINLFSSSFFGATYLWSGPNSFTSSAQNPSIPSASTAMTGQYNLTVTSIEGCQNTASVNGSVVAMPIPIIIPSSNALCFGTNLSLSGSGGVNYLWTGPNGFTSPGQNTGINNVSLLANGIYTLLVTTGPCSIAATQSITVYPLPNPIVSYTPACETKSMQLNAGGGISYAWLGPNAFSSNLQNPVINPAFAANSGTYLLTVTDINGCQAFANIPIAVLLNPVVITTGTTVCFGAPATLRATGAVNYTWTGPQGYTSNTANAFITSALSISPETYVVIGTAANSCTSTEIALLETNELPQPSLTITPSRVCLNNTVSLQGLGGDSYEWRGPYNFFSNKQNVIFEASNIGYTGNFTLTAKNNFGCTTSIAKALMVDELPQGELVSNNKNYCVPFCATYELKNTSSSKIENINWQIGNNLNNAPTFVYCVSKPGNHIVTGIFTNALGCTNSATFAIESYPLPTANFDYSPQKPIAGIDEVLFTNQSTGQQLTRWDWFFMTNNGFNANSKNTSYLFDNSGTYPIAMIVQNSWGCVDTIIKSITVENGFNVYVPNSFTPNEDGNNDTFYPKATGVVKYNMIIYDRWGEKVFETNDLSKVWDGKFKGVDCKSDVYVWKLYARDLGGEVKNMNGYVTLYR
jgi:gliding motility-associated-like protein